MPQRFLCIICTKVLRDARLTECCGHHFCDSCLTNWRRTQYYGGKTCPHCRVGNFKHMLNREKIRDINELRIRCTYHKAGCEWEGELGALKQHLQSESGCGYVVVACPNDTKKVVGYNCGKMKRKDLKAHMHNKCYFRLYDCEHCGHRDTCIVITTRHYQTCAEYPLHCPNTCGKVDVKRKDVASHRLVCPLQNLRCSFERCTVMVKCKDMMHHGEECNYRPYICEHCCYSDSYIVVTKNHYERCPEYPLSCPNGCGARDIKRKDIPNHCSSCPRELIACSFQRCPEKIERRYMKNHRETCSHRPYECEHCGFRETYDFITRFHYNECPEYPLPCPNQCNARNIKRKKLSKHRKFCPLEPLDCPFKDAGCTVRVVRKDMEQHMEKNTQQHLLESHQELTRKFDRLTHSHRELAQENEVLKARVKELEPKKQSQPSYAFPTSSTRDSSRPQHYNGYDYGYDRNDY